MGKFETIKPLSEETNFSKDNIYTDPSATLYQLLNLQQANSFGEFQGEGKSSGGVSTVLKGLLWSGYNMIKRGNQGNPYMMGATYFIDQNGKVLMEHKDKYTNDYLNYQDIMNLVPQYYKYNK